MKETVLALLLFLLAGCALPNAYSVYRSDGRYTAYAVSAHHLVGVLHGNASPGDVVSVHTGRGLVRGVVKAVQGQRVVIRTDDMLLMGDSGAGVENEAGELVGSIFARGRK